MISDPSTKTILVVDDDQDFREQLKLPLTAAGFNVVEAPGQAEAEQILQTLRPDLAILDLMMENMDAGFVLGYHIKKKDPTIPVIMITAVTSETGLEFESGRTGPSWIKADAILAKPIRFEQLRREIARLLKD